MDIRFDGKTALVTGSGKGIGRLLTVKLAEAGAKVYAVSRTKSDLESLQQEDPKNIHTLCLDVGEWETTSETLRGCGPFDILVNNAGVMDVKKLGELTEEEVDKTLDINVKAVINITQLVAKEMMRHGKEGAIVNVSSVMGTYAAPHYSVYCASKGAVHQLTRAMAAEYGPYKIRVNSVNPTVVRTSMAEKEGFFDPYNEQARLLKHRTPLRKFAEPQDVIGPIFFLLSEHASMVTGVALPVDGGLSVCFA